jgi:hypothetical protein
MEFEALSIPWHNDMDGMRRGLWDCGIAVIDSESQPGVTAASFACAQGDSGWLRRLQQGQFAKFRVLSDYRACAPDELVQPMSHPNEMLTIGK